MASVEKCINHGHGLTGMKFGYGEVGDALVRAHEEVDRVEGAIYEPCLSVLNMYHSIRPL